MFLDRLKRFRHSLSFRLTLWYTIVFTFIVVSTLVIFFFIIHSYVYGKIDDYLEAEIKEFRVKLATEGLKNIKSDISHEETDRGENKIFFRLVTPNGETLASSDMSAWSEYPPQASELAKLSGKEVYRKTKLISGDQYPTRSIKGFIGPGIILEIGQTLKAEQKFMEAYRSSFFAILLFSIIISIVVGRFMADRALSGLKKVTQTAIDITRGELDHRVPEQGTDDEIDQLVDAFNSMLDRIQALIIAMKEINDNIAHDLRSPIARIRCLAETSLTAQTSLDEYQAMGANTVEECDRLLQIINTMLDISEMDAGVAKQELQPINVLGMLNDTKDFFQPVAEEKGISLIVKTDPNIIVYGDLKKLQRVLANLLDNALKHTPPEGEIIFSARVAKGKVLISCRDTGIGISSDELPSIFDRFYRGEKSRSKEGSGLGLSLARAIIRNHGGDLTVTSAIGEGSVFTIALPEILPSPAIPNL